MASVDPFSLISIHVETFFDKTPLCSGSAFIIQRDSKYFLITNWHIVSGRDPETKKIISPTGGVPNKIQVWHHKKGKLGSWQAIIYNLLDKNNQPLWKEKDFPNGEKYDVVAFPVDIEMDIDFYPLDLSLKDANLFIPPSEQVSIIGFPFGLAADGKLPIWKTGHVASDVEVDIGRKPVFLIDAMTKSGMSGSPVIARRSGLYQTKNGSVNLGGGVNRFMGIYSGRKQDEENVHKSNLGMVWKPEVIDILFK